VIEASMCEMENAMEDRDKIEHLDVDKPKDDFGIVRILK
jgi:hypothetical protein